MLCDELTKEELKSKVEKDRYSPKHYRINLPLMNSENFAKTFKCPVGSKMNPKKKCPGW